jgi:hypothetical protein
MIKIIMPRFLRAAYHKEPLSSFILIIGAVDAVIGGVGGRWSLLSFGIVTILLAAAVRWWQQQPQIIPSQKVSRKMLPPSSTNSPLPVLNHTQKQR